LLIRLRGALVRRNHLGAIAERCMPGICCLLIADQCAQFTPMWSIRDSAGDDDFQIPSIGPPVAKSVAFTFFAICVVLGSHLSDCRVMPASA
jgi:hypothetical protein